MNNQNEKQQEKTFVSKFYDNTRELMGSKTMVQEIYMPSIKIATGVLVQELGKRSLTVLGKKSVKDYIAIYHRGVAVAEATQSVVLKLSERINSDLANVRRKEGKSEIRLADDADSNE